MYVSMWVRGDANVCVRVCVLDEYKVRVRARNMSSPIQTQNPNSKNQTVMTLPSLFPPSSPPNTSTVVCAVDPRHHREEDTRRKIGEIGQYGRNSLRRGKSRAGKS